MDFFGSLPSTPTSVTSGSDIKPFEFNLNANCAGLSRNSTIVISDEESGQESAVFKSEPKSDSLLARENVELKKTIEKLSIHVEALQSRVLQQINSSFEPRISSTAYDADVEKENDESVHFVPFSHHIDFLIFRTIFVTIFLVIFMLFTHTKSLFTSMVACIMLI